MLKIVPDLKLRHRPLYNIAMQIFDDWPPIPDTARAYLRPMLHLDQITDVYGVDSAEYILGHFVAAAHGWRGETARKVKLEIKSIFKLLNKNEVLRQLARHNVEATYALP